jgi:hypothetical protein
MSENPKQDIRVRIFPSGMIEVYGADADAVGLVAAAASRGMYRAKPNETQPELPPANGAESAPAVTLKPPEPNYAVQYKGRDTTPFYDRSVTMHHPAIIGLEQHILASPDGREFEHLWMRKYVGEEITGHPRECMTRAVTTLMGRLVGSGVVVRLAQDHWKKVARVTKK